jgi:hypothetical protein
MRTSHEGLVITSRDWSIFFEHSEAVLAQFEVSENVKHEVLMWFESFKELVINELRSDISRRSSAHGWAVWTGRRGPQTDRGREVQPGNRRDPVHQPQHSEPARHQHL